LRLRAPRPRAARGARRPGPSRAADPTRLRRQELADRAGREGERAAGGDGRGRRGGDHAGGDDGGDERRMGMKHLLGVENLSREEMDRILDRAESFAEVGRRDIKKVPTLRGRTIVNLFYESSTRTLSSFELAAKRLSADVVSVKSAGSSVDKGESLKDT